MLFYFVTTLFFYASLYSICQAAKVIDRSRVSCHTRYFWLSTRASQFSHRLRIRSASNSRLKRGAGEKKIGRKNRVGVCSFRYNYAVRRIIRGKAGAASGLDASQDKYQFYDGRGYIFVRSAKLARCQRASIRSLASAAGLIYCCRSSSASSLTLEIP